MLHFVSRNFKAELKMNSNHLVIGILLRTFQVVTGYFDTSYYQILSEPNGENFAYFADRCTGKLGLNTKKLWILKTLLWCGSKYTTAYFLKL